MSPLYQRLLMAGLLAAPAAMAAPSHQITVDDFFSIANMGSVVISPDGNHALWLESRWDKELDKSQADLWQIDLQNRAPVRLTFTDESESRPVWSPNGQFIYYIGKEKREGAKAPYNGKPQVFRIAKGGSEAVAMTREKDGVNAFELSKDGAVLYFLANKETKDKDTWAGMRASHSAPQYGHGKRDTNPLYRLDLQNFRQELLLDDDKVVWDFSVSPDGKQIARITTDDNELVYLEGWSRVEVFNTADKQNRVLEDKSWREQAASPYGWLEGLAWDTRGERLAFRIDFDGHPGRLFVVNTQGKGQMELTRPGKVTLNGADIQWRPGSDELCYRGAEAARVKLFCTEINGLKQGDTRAVVGGDLVMGGYSFDSRGQRLAFSHNGLSHFSDLFVADADGKKATPKRLTNINPQSADWQLPQISIYKWQAPDGTEVEGILELPFGWDKSKGKLPLVVQIHGGPTAATPYSLQHRSYGRASFPAQGWALLSPNYRGSTGYGDKFLTDLVGREHDIEVKDILSGVDKLIADGIVDGDKLAVMGWSNGGYLTNALISTTDRFKAASSGAGVFDQRLQWMLEDTPGHVVNFMEGLPWEKADAYTHGSSLSHADKIKTPTLIHIGEKDARVPLGHAQGLYRALHNYLGVPVELVVYPDEGHGLSKYQHRKAKMEWDLKWFNYYVLGIEP